MEKRNLHKEAMDMLLETSRTFYIPISYLASGLQEAVASAYLCMRAIDEIEDHPQLGADHKIHLLVSISKLLKLQVQQEELVQEDVIQKLFTSYQQDLPDVTLQLHDWIRLCPDPIRKRVLASTAEMAGGMARWVDKNWQVKNEEDLDEYTYYVAGLVGVMLSDIWKWYEGIETDRQLAIAFGRGLQAVNIVRNQQEDEQERGVSFFPPGWEQQDMITYARNNLALADQYLESVSSASETIRDFCSIPLTLAKATLDAIQSGDEKLSRFAVTELVSRATGK